MVSIGDFMFGGDLAMQRLMGPFDSISTYFSFLGLEVPAKFHESHELSR